MDAVEKALDKSTTFEVSQVPTGPLKRAALLNNSDICLEFILQAIWVWALPPSLRGCPTVSQY